jgi:hypothetical protein
MRTTRTPRSRKRKTTRRIRRRTMWTTRRREGGKYLEIFLLLCNK